MAIMLHKPRERSSIEGYAEAMRIVAEKPGIREGQIFKVVYGDPDDYEALTVWESRESWERFFQEGVVRAGAAAAAVDTSRFEIYDVLDLYQPTVPDLTEGTQTAVVVYKPPEGVSVEGYRAAQRHLAETGSNRDDQIFMAAYGDPDDFQLVVVWKTREAWERFQREDLPAAARAAGTDPDRLQVYDVFDIYQPQILHERQH